MKADGESPTALLQVILRFPLQGRHRYWDATAIQPTPWAFFVILVDLFVFLATVETCPKWP